MPVNSRMDNRLNSNKGVIGPKGKKNIKSPDKPLPTDPPAGETPAPPAETAPPPAAPKPGTKAPADYKPSKPGARWSQNQGKEVNPSDPNFLKFGQKGPPADYKPSAEGMRWSKNQGKEVMGKPNTPSPVETKPVDRGSPEGAPQDVAASGGDQMTSYNQDLNTTGQAAADAMGGASLKKMMMPQVPKWAQEQGVSRDNYLQYLNRNPNAPGNTDPRFAPKPWEQMQPGGNMPAPGGPPPGGGPGEQAPPPSNEPPLQYRDIGNKPGVIAGPGGKPIMDPNYKPPGGAQPGGNMPPPDAPPTAGDRQYQVYPGGMPGTQLPPGSFPGGGKVPGGGPMPMPPWMGGGGGMSPGGNMYPGAAGGWFGGGPQQVPGMPQPGGGGQLGMSNPGGQQGWIPQQLQGATPMGQGVPGGGGRPPFNPMQPFPMGGGNFNFNQMVQPPWMQQGQQGGGAAPGGQPTNQLPPWMMMNLYGGGR